MENTRSSAAEISRVAVRLSPSGVERPALWFDQADAQSSFAGIINKRTKLHYVISQL
jgi:hypothetical protein